MPLDHGFRLDNVEGLSPVGPDAGQDIPECSVAPAEGRSVNISLLNLDLMAECRVLEDQGLTSPEYGKQKLKDEIEHNGLFRPGRVTP
jgi:hypothetical protein